MVFSHGFFSPASVTATKQQCRSGLQPITTSLNKAAHNKPFAGSVEGLHHQASSLTTTVNLVTLARNAPCPAHQMKKPTLRLAFSTISG